MPKGVGSGFLVDAGFVQGHLEGVLQGVCADAPLVLGEQPWAAVAVVLVVGAQKSPHMIGKRDGAVLPPFAEAHP